MPTPNDKKSIISWVWIIILSIMAIVSIWRQESLSQTRVYIDQIERELDQLRLAVDVYSTMLEQIPDPVVIPAPQKE